MRVLPTLIVCLVASPVFAVNTSTNVETYRVFGPEHPGIYKHPASITQLANGDLYLAYYGGSGEYEDDTAVFGSRLPVGANDWTAPVVIADTPDRGEGNPVVWQAPDGLVWLFYVNRYGKTWSDGIVKCKISKDGAQTWSDSFLLAMEKGSMVRGQPIVLANGDYLLPMYHETGGDKEQLGPDSASYFMRYDPKKKTWKATNRITSPEGNLQPQVVQISDEDLVAFLRRGGGYEPTEEGWMLRSESHDGGYTWSPAEPTDFPNPNAAVDFIKLQNGHLLLVYNHNMNARTPLTVAISTDGAKTFPYRRDIGGGGNTFAYPYAIQTADGKIHVIYTTNNRTTIMHAVFDEAAVMEPEFQREK
jgi:predicted neuraminidase